MLVERHVPLVHHSGSAGKLFECRERANVIDVCVRCNNRLYLELVAFKRVDDLSDLIAGIDDNGALCLLIANDDAVAL